MIENLMVAAEKMATNVSRRGFLSQLGRAAIVAAASVGGVLLTAKNAHAAKANQSCDANSSFVCVGKSVGDPCNLLRRQGKCTAAPACYCRG